MRAIYADNFPHITTNPAFRPLTDDDCRAVLRIVPPDGGGIGLAPVDGDRLRHAMAADGLGEEARSRPLVALLREQEIDRLSGLIDGAIQVIPLAFDPDV